MAQLRGRGVLTSRQLQALGFILGAGRPVTIREVMLSVGATSPNSGRKLLTALKQRGLVRHEKDLSRTIRPACQLFWLQQE